MQAWHADGNSAKQSLNPHHWSPHQWWKICWGVLFIVHWCHCKVLAVPMLRLHLEDWYTGYNNNSSERPWQILWLNSFRHKQSIQALYLLDIITQSIATSLTLQQLFFDGSVVSKPSHPDSYVQNVIVQPLFDKNKCYNDKTNEKLILLQHIWSFINYWWLLLHYLDQLLPAYNQIDLKIMNTEMSLTTYT